MRTVIYGNGAMARVLYSYVRHEWEVAGFTVDDFLIADSGDQFCGLPLVPFSRVETVFAPASHRMITAVGYAQMNDVRKLKHREGRDKGYEFANYVHSSTLMHDGVRIGENCVILDHVAIHPGCQIAAGTFICSNVSIGHDCVIEEYNWINSGVAIAGNCRIGRECFFGVNSSVANEIRVGARNFIAANTLIHRDTKDGEVYLTEPGQLFRLGSDAFLRFIEASAPGARQA